MSYISQYLDKMFKDVVQGYIEKEIISKVIESNNLNEIEEYLKFTSNATIDADIKTFICRNKQLVNINEEILINFLKYWESTYHLQNVYGNNISHYYPYYFYLIDGIIDATKTNSNLIPNSNSDFEQLSKTLLNTDEFYYLNRLHSIPETDIEKKNKAFNVNNFYEVGLSNPPYYLYISILKYYSKKKACEAIENYLRDVKISEQIKADNELFVNKSKEILDNLLKRFEKEKYEYILDKAIYLEYMKDIINQIKGYLGVIVNVEIIPLDLAQDYRKGLIDKLKINKE